MNRDFPGGRKKALTFGFDDCEQYDRKLAELFRTYKVKATFFLITDSLGARIPFHRYGRDTVVERVTAKELPVTYRGMELAWGALCQNRCGYPWICRSPDKGGIPCLESDLPVPRSGY